MHDLSERASDSKTASAIPIPRAYFFLQQSQFSFLVAFIQNRQFFRARRQLCVRSVRLLQNVEERKVGIELLRQRKRVLERNH